VRFQASERSLASLVDAVAWLNCSSCTGGYDEMPGITTILLRYERLKSDIALDMSEVDQESDVMPYGGCQAWPTEY
jgi:hypothetical protein